MTTSRKKRFIFFVIVASIITLFNTKIPDVYSLLSKVPGHPKVCPKYTATHTITPINNTNHFLVSAFLDQRVKGFDVRIIGIFRRDSIKPLHCVFCCEGVISSTVASEILQHRDHFGFPFTATDVMCPIPFGCRTSHVTLQAQPDRSKAVHQIWHPIRNQKSRAREEKKMQFNFTVCISNLFGKYNNVLQFAQTLEMYRLLGVDRVVIYNTSCGPDLNRLLQSYSQTGFVEMVSWPIHSVLNPSTGWLFSKSGGDVHYYGQLTTLNECLYRSMERSRYVLLNDIDEIIMPYKHDNLVSLMAELQKQHPTTGVFYIQNHIFPKQHSEPSGRFRLPQWDGLPGVNILEHIYKEDPDEKVYHPHKMIVQPRFVEQVSVHETLKSSGPVYKVPPDVCRIIHVRGPLRGLRLELLKEDKRLWDFQEKLIPKVDEALKRAGLLRSEKGR